jgi:septal ring factor EnvC (AmiA/AmiB activator)
MINFNTTPKWKLYLGAGIVVAVILYLIFTNTGGLYDKLQGKKDEVPAIEQNIKTLQDSLVITEKQKDSLRTEIQKLEEEIAILKQDGVKVVIKREKEIKYVKELTNEEMQSWFDEKVKDLEKEK